MAPGPLVRPSLNGQKRDNKRGKPRRQPLSRAHAAARSVEVWVGSLPVYQASLGSLVCSAQYLPAGTLPSSFTLACWAWWCGPHGP